jgi:hypothetical protein
VLSTPLSILYALERIPLLVRNRKGEPRPTKRATANSGTGAEAGAGSAEGGRVTPLAPAALVAPLAAVSSPRGLEGHKDLVLHIIGATQTDEMMVITKYEEILHLCTVPSSY